MIQDIIINIFLFAIGLLLLLKSSEKFVEFVSAFAKSIGVSQFIIGLTLVAFGTSMPELVSSLIASIKGSPDIVIGNILGSNIANIGLIIGITAFISSVKADRDMIKRDGYMMLASAIVTYIFVVSHELSRTESVILILMYLAYLIFLFKERSVFETGFFDEYLDYFINFEFLKVVWKKGKNEKKSISISYKDMFFSAASLTIVILSANLIVDKSVWLAGTLGVTEGFIGLTLIALGTSLPELAVSVTAAKKGHGEIALGNVLGSNIVNILFILSLSSFFSPLSLSAFESFFIGPLMVLLSFLLIIFIAVKNRLRKIHGVIFLFIYLIFLAGTVLNQFAS